jgi:hypothetical protein
MAKLRTVLYKKYIPIEYEPMKEGEFLHPGVPRNVVSGTGVIQKSSRSMDFFIGGL